MAGAGVEERLISAVGGFQAVARDLGRQPLDLYVVVVLQRQLNTVPQRKQPVGLGFGVSRGRESREKQAKAYLP